MGSSGSLVFAWVRSGAPMDRRFHSGSSVLTRARLVSVWFILVRVVHSHGHRGRRGFACVHWGQPNVRQGSSGFTQELLGLVGSNRVHSGAPSGRRFQSGSLVDTPTRLRVVELIRVQLGSHKGA